MKSIQFVSLTALSAVSLLTRSCSEKLPVEKKPDIIIIQLDDLGYDDLGIHGNPYVESGFMDSFAHRSVRFGHFYVNPVCAPTRASLLTGRHFLRTGVSHVHGGKDFLNPTEQTLGDIFRAGGYKTAIFGKWHSGNAEGYYPWQRGFDEAYQARLYKHRNSEGEYNGKPVYHQKWATEVIFDYARDFIIRNEMEPCFLYLSFLTVHSPLDAPENLISRYQEMGLSRNLSTIYAMIEQLDIEFNKFFQFLQENERLENAVILFMSDNGPAIENGTLTDEDRDIRYVNGYKGHKGNIWENGIKSPLFFYQKGRYENGLIEEVCDVTDILPTLMDIAGLDSELLINELDGISFRPLLEGRKRSTEKMSFNYANSGWPPSELPWSPEGVKDEYRPLDREDVSALDPMEQIISIHKGEHKLLFNPAEYENTPDQENHRVLVNLRMDPKENTNLLTAEEKIYHQLSEELQKWFESIKESPHSFSMPVFFITDSLGVIPAWAPVKISPELKNAFNYLGGWQENSSAEYALDFSVSGDYTISLEWMDPKPDPPEMEVLDPGYGKGTLINGVNTLSMKKGRQTLVIQCKESKDPKNGLKYIKLNRIVPE